VRKEFQLLIALRKVILLLAVALFFVSCESNMGEVRKINISEFNPVGEAKDFNLKYTDSGTIKAILISPQMLDYSQLEFPFTEFPKGVKVTVFDNKGNKSYVTSDYAISYSGSNIIDLSGNVKITTQDGKMLETVW
jgi:LPS export ABC transporter protein LptC